MIEDEREMLFRLAEELAGYVVLHYDRENFQNSPTIDHLARVAAMMEAGGRAVPPIILDALRKSVEAGRPISVA